MGYALSAFLASKDVIFQLPGIADVSFLRKILSKAGERLEELDEQLVDEDDEDDFTHEQALRELFSGQITAEHHGSRYGWAFESICDSLGCYLPNQSFSPCNVEWYKQLDEYLATTELNLHFEDLVNNCPIKIPLADDRTLDA